MKDERIQTTANHYAAIGFFIWELLLSISLCYRTMILKQHPREWWDIGVIFFFGIILIFIMYANKGVFDQDFKKRWLIIFSVLIIGLPTLFFITGEIHSLVEVGGLLIGLILGLGVVIGIAHFLNQRWKRNEGIEDEN